MDEPTITVDEATLDTLSYPALVELARHTGRLVVEEEPYPELIRTRLRRSGTT